MSAELNTPIVSLAEMRAIEERCAEFGISTDQLTENAGLAIAEALAELDPDLESVVFLIGKGSNGSDGIYAAAELARRGVDVRLMVLLERPQPDLVLAELVKGSKAKLNASPTSDIAERCADADLIVDAVLGAGLTKPIADELGEQLQAAQNSGTPICAIDLPSGVNGDSGAADKYALRADFTLMLGAYKQAVTLPGCAETLGDVVLLDIGIPEQLLNAAAHSAAVFDAEQAERFLPRRSASSHKGTYGHVALVCGAKNYPGAAILAASAAVRSGAGLVTLFVPDAIHAASAAAVPEAIVRPLGADNDGGISADSRIELDKPHEDCYLVLGPGLGRTDGVLKFVENALGDMGQWRGVLLDADALFALSTIKDWRAKIKSDNLVLTPHPKELARLLGVMTAEVQADRLRHATEAAERFNATVVLKGARTLVAAPGRKAWLTLWANSGLAKGGTGDVLAGLIGGLLASSGSSGGETHNQDLAALGVYLHGLAGAISSDTFSPYAVTATDVIYNLGRAFIETDLAQ